MNCNQNFENIELLNSHIERCVDEQNLESLERKIQSTRGREDLYSEREFGVRSKTTQKHPMRCPQCGIKMANHKQGRSLHKCESETVCFLCSTKIPSKLLQDHIAECLIRSEDKLRELQSRAQVNARDGNHEDQAESLNHSPIRALNKAAEQKLCQSSKNSSSPNSESNSQPRSEPESRAQVNARDGNHDDQLRSLNNSPIEASNEAAEQKLSQSSKTSSAPNSESNSQPRSEPDSQPSSMASASSSDQNNAAQEKKRERERVAYEDRKFWASVNRSLEAPAENSSNYIVTRSKAAVKNVQSSVEMSAQDRPASIDEDQESPKTSPIKSMKEKLRRSKDFKSFLDISPMIDFFHSCCNNSEKRLILASVLPNQMEETDFTLFASLFQVKKNYVKMLHNERNIKLLEGRNYPILVTRSDDGQAQGSKSCFFIIRSCFVHKFRAYLIFQSSD